MATLRGVSRGEMERGRRARGEVAIGGRRSGVRWVVRKWKVVKDSWVDSWKDGVEKWTEF